MSHSYSSLFYHIVWTTKNRMPYFIDRTIRKRICGYLEKVIESKEVELLSIGAMPDHIHILVRLKGSQAPSLVMQKVKAISSGFAKNLGDDFGCFAWQIGNGLFTLGASQIETVRNYIVNQEEHHKNWALDDELEFFSKL